MRKSLLLKQNNELFDKLQIATLNNRRLREENEKLKEKVKVLCEKIEILENNKEIITESYAQTEDVFSETQPSETENSKSAEISPQPEVEVSPEIEYGSKVIGDIIFSSTESVNLLMKSDKENLKELVNLIMGKTEVAKAQILDIVSSDSSFDLKTAMMDSEAADAKEYFKSVLGQ